MKKNTNDVLDDFDLVDDQEDLFEDNDSTEDNDDSYDDEDDVDLEGEEDEANDDEDALEEEDEADDPDAPAWENKRIKKMAERHKASKAEIKSLKAQVARLTELTGTDDPKVFVKVAEKSGILPQFIKPADAKRIAEADNLSQRIDTLTEILDELEDSGDSEYTDSQGNTWKRAGLRQEKRTAERKYAEIAKAANDAKKSARKQMIAVINAGLKALRAQKSDKQAKRSKIRNEDVRSSRQRFDDDEPNARSRKSKTTAHGRHSFDGLSAKERARAKLHALFMADE